MNEINFQNMVTKDNAFTVQKLTQHIKERLEGEFSRLWVSGELSNVVHHRSGHLYFTLKDDSAEIRGVMFRGFSRYLPFTPEEGMHVLVFGSLSVYEPRGQYQLVAKQMEASGIGSLFLALESLKKKLLEEGLFDDRLKKPIPKYPKTVGVITSPSGAAVRDIMTGLERRAPYVSICFRPSIVQGNDAAPDLISALRQMEKEGMVDVIIIGRGGGSIEDLWAFNNEDLAREISNVSIPIISAVGHETDFTISDFVSDVRASTPSAAAELVAIPLTDINTELIQYRVTLQSQLRNILDKYWQKLDYLSERTSVQEPSKMIIRIREKLIEKIQKLEQTIFHSLSLRQIQLQSINETLLALSPKGILKRGYSLAYIPPENKLIRTAKDIGIGTTFILETGEGKFQGEKIKEIP